MTPAEVRAESFASMIAFVRGLTGGEARPAGNHMSLERYHELKAADEARRV